MKGERVTSRLGDGSSLRLGRGGIWGKLWLTAVAPPWRWGRGGMIGCDITAIVWCYMENCEESEVVVTATAVCVSVSVRDFAAPPDVCLVGPGSGTLVGVVVRRMAWVSE